MKKKRKDKLALEQRQITEEQEAKQAIKKRRRSLLLIITAAATAVIVITTAILVLVLIVFNPYIKSYEDPVATIKLSNGMELKFTVTERTTVGTGEVADTYSAAATNFIYLARIGYFDGAVLFDSTADGYVRFGGWLEDGTHRGDDDTEFLSKIERTITSTDSAKTVYDYKINKFGYRMDKTTEKTTYVNSYKTFGRLSFICGAAGSGNNGTATEFQIAVTEGDKADTFNGKVGTYAAFGEAANEKTLTNLTAIAALSTQSYAAYDGCAAPVDGDGLIKILSIKFSKLYEAKWKSFNFMTYFLKPGTSSAPTRQNGMRTWSYTSQLKSGA